MRIAYLQREAPGAPFSSRLIVRGLAAGSHGTRRKRRSRALGTARSVHAFSPGRYLYDTSGEYGSVCGVDPIPGPKRAVMLLETSDH